MRGARLQSYCRAAAWFPRKRPKLGFRSTGKLFAISYPSHADKLFTTLVARALPIRSRHDDDVEKADKRQNKDIEVEEAFQAARPFDFEVQEKRRDEKRTDADVEAENREQYWKKLRFLPVSSAYFTGTPRYIDDLVLIRKMLRKYSNLPLLPNSEAPRVAWTKYDSYTQTLGERVKPAMFHRMVAIMKRLNRIDPQLRTKELEDALGYWTRSVGYSTSDTDVQELDEWGRMKGIGRRKASSATAWIVEGEGDVLINGKQLHQVFARVHDRESAIWALTSTDRMDKYNVFALVSGGGPTGQAEALTLAVSKALIAHEPSLKTMLRKAGCVARDPRRVERKKPGRLKARKKPAWVKR